MNIQRAISAMHRGIEKFNFIEDGDRVAIGLSGGKDSMLLTACLGTYRRFSNKKFSLMALCIDTFNDANKEALQAFCKEYSVELKIIPSNIGEVVFDIRKEKNPCSLCAKMTRGALCSACNELGYNKLALAHNADDMIETFMLSLSHENRLNAMQPKGYMSKTNVTVIRPLIFLCENQIKWKFPQLSESFVKLRGFPICWDYNKNYSFYGNKKLTCFEFQGSYGAHS